MTCLAEDSGKLQDYPAPHPPFRVPVWAVGGLLYIFVVVVVVQLSRCQAGLDLCNGAVDITLFSLLYSTIYSPAYLHFICSEF